MREDKRLRCEKGKGLRVSGKRSVRGTKVNLCRKEALDLMSDGRGGHNLGLRCHGRKAWKVQVINCLPSPSLHVAPSMEFPAFSLQSLACLALTPMDLARVPAMFRPHVVASLQTCRRGRLRQRVQPTDFFTITGRETSTKRYGKRKLADISRAEVSFANYFMDE